jgi:L-lactate dehydrogenase complex protein LldF
MRIETTKDHSELAEAFIQDDEKASWHDGALWWIRQKRDIQANKHLNGKNCVRLLQP